MSVLTELKVVKELLIKIRMKGFEDPEGPNEEIESLIDNVFDLIIDLEKKEMGPKKLTRVLS